MGNRKAIRLECKRKGRRLAHQSRGVEPPKDNFHEEAQSSSSQLGGSLRRSAGGFQKESKLPVRAGWLAIVDLPDAAKIPHVQAAL